MMNQIHDRLTAFLERTNSLTGTELRDAFVNEVIETGGTYMEPPKGDNATSHLIEIGLHGIIGNGQTEAEALDCWRNAAQRQTDSAASAGHFVSRRVPFPTPRSHAEEITNMRAAK